jgi:hypothetical protein
VNSIVIENKSPKSKGDKNSIDTKLTLGRIKTIEIVEIKKIYFKYFGIPSIQSK